MKHSVIEYYLYINLCLVAKLLQALPLNFALFIGRCLGILIYCVDYRHRSIAYRNLRISLADRFSAPQLRMILRRNYQNLGMSIIETLRIPKINRDYLTRYINIKGKENLDNALREKRGAIILGAHFGSWEICFAVAGILRYPFYIFAEEQVRNPLLDRFLNQIRSVHGVNVLKVSQGIRQAIITLQKKMFLGMVIDHGVREGRLVNFLGRRVRTPTIAVRMGLKYNVPILISYIRRICGPKHELVILPPLEIKRSDNFENDVIDYLETINRITESYIIRYPEQYLWFYKRFKYSNQRNILILHDGRTGHLRQLQAVLNMIREEADRIGLEIHSKEVKIDFKNKIYSVLQTLSALLADRLHCQGCLWCLRRFLKQEVFKELQSYFADIVISCGSITAAVNFVISAENKAKSVVIMRPATLLTKRFDLMIIPAHDNPPQKSNVIRTHGALNLISKKYIMSQASSLSSRIRIERDLVLGILLGGDTKRFRISLDLLGQLIAQVKLFAERNDAEILISTSRRTNLETEKLVKNEFSNYERCKLLVIANERNIPEAVGGILGLSKIVIVSPESISMISEAASAGRYVVVFKPQVNIGSRHARFLNTFVKNRYIYLADINQLASILEEINTYKPDIVTLQDNLPVKRAIKRLL